MTKREARRLARNWAAILIERLSEDGEAVHFGDNGEVRPEKDIALLQAALLEISGRLRG